MVENSVYCYVSSDLIPHRATCAQKLFTNGSGFSFKEIPELGGNMVKQILLKGIAMVKETSLYNWTQFHM